MRLFALGLLSTIAFANPPTLTPAQQAWVNLWMGQINPSPQNVAAVRTSLEDLLLDGLVSLPDVADPLAPTWSEATCDILLAGIEDLGKQCNDKKKNKQNCEAQVEPEEEVSVECGAEINSYLQCQSDLTDARTDYRDSCKGKHPPKH